MFQGIYLEAFTILTTPMRNKVYCLSAAILYCTIQSSIAQIAPNYEVATWSQFKPAAVSYTFDDNCSKQIPNALPLFDQLGYKVTFFAVVNWGPNWTELQKASNNGHEVASHTMSHPTDLGTLTTTAQDGEYKNSQSNINSKITNAKCLTIAYPNCKKGDVPTLQKYYIAGRTCAGSIIPNNPTDFFSLSSILTDTDGIKTGDEFNTKVNSAKSSKGWCVFLIHGIDGDGGFSNTQSSEIKKHLDYVNTNKADYWVATFLHVVKYIKERNAASLSETAINSDSLQLTFTDNLDNTIYNSPITIRRLLPTNWKTPKVYVGSTLIPSAVKTENGKQYIVFDAVADQGKIYLANTKTVTGLEETPIAEAVKLSPNPFTNEMDIAMKGDFSYTICSMAGKVVAQGNGTNAVQIGHLLDPGMYVLSIRQANRTVTEKIIKK